MNLTQDPDHFSSVCLCTFVKEVSTRNIQNIQDVVRQCLLYVFDSRARKARQRNATASAASSPMFSQKFSLDTAR